MDGTENRQDSSVATQDTSGGDKGTSKQPETFTKEQVVEVKRKAGEDALSAAGRTVALLAKREEALQAREDRAVADQKAKDEAELEDAGDDVDKTTRLKARQTHRETVAELARVKQQVKGLEEDKAESEKKTAVSTQEIRTREIATRLEVDANSLTNLVKFTDGSTEAIEALAQTLTPKKEPLLVDNSKTIGGGLSDEAFVTKLGKGDEPLTKDDVVRAKKLGIMR